MRIRLTTLAIAIQLVLASGCAIRVGHSMDRQSADVADPLPTVDQAVVAQATAQPRADPGAILSCDCLDHR
ncbi:MAG: hypothetical protein EBQ56_00850 [Proteobacteria bacterium]|jgi:hypothetical protein|nr:hypothetical protein [Actinomycetota bacterium]NBY46327.1 hypothetical protein [Pseudomonadota bacterium]